MGATYKQRVTRALALLLLAFVAPAFGAANDLCIYQRDASDSSTQCRIVVHPTSGPSLVYYDLVTLRPGQLTLGPRLSVSSGALNVAAPAYADLTGAPVWLGTFDGSYGALTGVPSTFAPSAHVHAAADTTSGTFALARIPALAISNTTGLQSALDGKAAAATTCAGYGITDCTTPSALSSALAGYATASALSSGLASKADSSALASYLTTSAATAAYYPLGSNPASYLTSASLSSYATTSALTSGLAGKANTATTCAGYGITDCVTSASLASTLTSYATAASLSSYLTTATAASTYATQSALTSGLAGKFNTPAGTTAQYVRGDGTLATTPLGTVTSITAGAGLSGGTITGTGTISLPNIGTAGTFNNVTTDAQGRVTTGTLTPFNFSQPATRTLAVSTSYQATDNTKAAILYPSYSCTNATQVLASSACTVQVRMGTGTLTCATGTVYYTQSLTVNLGVLITQGSTNPVPIFLPIGASFILCPSAGTFTISAVEQTAG